MGSERSVMGMMGPWVMWPYLCIPSCHLARAAADGEFHSFTHVMGSRCETTTGSERECIRGEERTSWGRRCDCHCKHCQAKSASRAACMHVSLLLLPHTFVYSGLASHIFTPMFFWSAAIAFLSASGVDDNFFS
jgi:hypothetical protein